MKVFLAGMNTRFYQDVLKDRRVLISFCDVANSNLWTSILERMRDGLYAEQVLDSGAFSAMTRGKVIDLGEYTDFCLEFGNLFTWVANLDVITDVDQSWNNFEFMLDQGVKNVLPVYHQGEELSTFRAMMDNGCRHIGLGFQRPIENPHQFLGLTFQELLDDMDPPLIHGFAMSDFMHDYPFHSTDSATWIAECRALRSVRGPHGCVGQAATVMRHLSDSEVSDMVLTSWERRSRRKAEGPKIEWQGGLFRG